jgi:hypothetical protein
MRVPGAHSGMVAASALPGRHRNWQMLAFLSAAAPHRYKTTRICRRPWNRRSADDQITARGSAWG